MKRHSLVALYLVTGIAAAASAAQPSTPVKYPRPPGSVAYYHGDHPVRPVYQQPLVPPEADEHGVTIVDDPMEEQVIADNYSEYTGEFACTSHDCARPWDMWVRGEYLTWWGEGTSLPALVTTATGSGSGILSDSDTQVLFGGHKVDNDQRDGGRFTLGAWLDEEHRMAIEASIFAVEDLSTGFEVQSQGEPLLSRPFFNVELQTEAVQIIAAPGVSTGGVFISTESEVHGAELLLRRRLDQCCDRRIDLLYGYRYAGLDESLLIRDELNSVDPNSNVPVGTVVGGFDSFQTFNQFHGGQLGLAIDVYRRRWTLGLAGKVGLGNMRQQVTIGGSTFVAVPEQETIEAAGGLLTQPSNLGGFVRDEFAVIPEGQLNLRYCLTQNVELSVGYTVIYYSDVVRPADQIDLRVDPRQITDPDNASAIPAFDFVGSEFWLQGINAGLEYKF
ncbi:MAG: BBP7 family outer membrane beta-barrel protein [Pirellulales bacterium]